MAPPAGVAPGREWAEIGAMSGATPMRRALLGAWALASSLALSGCSTGGPLQLNPAEVVAATAYAVTLRPLNDRLDRYALEQRSWTLPRATQIIGFEFPAGTTVIFVDQEAREDWRKARPEDIISFSLPQSVRFWGLTVDDSITTDTGLSSPDGQFLWVVSLSADQTFHGLPLAAGEARLTAQGRLYSATLSHTIEANGKALTKGASIRLQDRHANTYCNGSICFRPAAAAVAE